MFNNHEQCKNVNKITFLFFVCVIVDTQLTDTGHDTMIAKDLAPYFDWMHDQYNSDQSVTARKLREQFPELTASESFGVYRAWQNEI